MEDFTGFEGHSGMVMCQGGEPDTDMNFCCSTCENGFAVDGTCGTVAN